MSFLSALSPSLITVCQDWDFQKYGNPRVFQCANFSYKLVRFLHIRICTTIIHKWPGMEVFTGLTWPKMVHLTKASSTESLAEANPV